MKNTTAFAIGTAISFAGLGLGYAVVLRPRFATWGATRDEAERTMPGDELLPNPEIRTTRAITVAADPAAIWPWLVQIGPGRGGAYTYDWIENLLGLDMHSADEILPEFQHPALGDAIALGTTGPRMRIEVLEADRSLVFGAEDGNWVWSFNLYPEPAGTRLISRNLISLTGASPSSRLFTRLVAEPGSLIMERKMLSGIRTRAERARPAAGHPANRPDSGHISSRKESFDVRHGL
ncbi:SRPBCC family protein [Nocardia fluminea]|uniref:SRPBCC family protein n=1 Tax=Nocardia fluminea TaxID=134984 RepID=UPI0034011E30